MLNTVVPQLTFMDESNYPPDIPKHVRSLLLAYAGKDIPLVVNACIVFKNGLSLLQDFLTELNALDNLSPQMKQYLNQKARKSSSSSFSLLNYSSSRFPAESSYLWEFRPYSTVDVRLSLWSSF